MAEIPQASGVDEIMVYLFKASSTFLSPHFSLLWLGNSEKVEL